MAMCSPSRVCVTGFFSLLCMGLSGCPGSIDDPSLFVKPDSSQKPDGSEKMVTMYNCAMGVDKVELEILAKRCGNAGCHDSVTHMNNLNLATPGIASRIAGRMAMTCTTQPLVTAGDPMKSFLFIKLQTNPTCNGSPAGIRMPLGGMVLNESEMNCMRAWIMSQGGGMGPGTDAGRTNTDAGTNVRDAAADTNRRG